MWYFIITPYLHRRLENLVPRFISIVLTKSSFYSKRSFVPERNKGLLTDCLDKLSEATTKTLLMKSETKAALWFE